MSTSPRPPRILDSSTPTKTPPMASGKVSGARLGLSRPELDDAETGGLKTTQGNIKGGYQACPG